MTLKAISPETQIENAFFGMSEKDKESLDLKVAFTTKNIERVIQVNGKKVFNAIVKENDIWYNFRKNDGSFHKYYYPIQYAKITFSRGHDEILEEVIGIAVKAHTFLQLNQMDDFREEMRKFENFSITRK